MSWRISGGRVLRAGALTPGALHLAGGVIVPDGGARGFDAGGLLVLPGLVDIHGDAQERALQPRPGVDFPAPFALADAARQCLAAGVTTAFLGVTLSWEPGLRSLPMFRAVLAALETPPAGPDLRVHLRFEADNLDAEPEALAAIAAGRVHLLGFNDHTPGILAKLSNPKELGKLAGRAGVGEGEYLRLAERAAARRAEVPASRARMAEAARRAGIPMLSHDDADVATRAAFRALGARICEFPMAEAVAEEARAAGEPVVMGAPNVLRGGSHLGWASAAPLAERGLVTVLASDYHWPALLAAPFRLAQRGAMELARAWALVSENPAEALGLHDRGRIAEGLRGDVVLTTPEGGLVAVFAGGDLAWLAPGAAWRVGG
ncbi:alpha-D-ribose 1-methylphosphonate 5-triphosphate diphosphatase [Rubritepida flocculans]|uniref:alpha-D-ribose 1-methylphosphonate 5-triphosphate diphosphatase n=1 Tax=Rubritepida flocculans TaxID=182403 RepID=UPI00041265BC|nr:alpha-D-ribose 1-methylphosphonate 5-triphosphate diphosphatase [Rubritepida flocculans]